MACEDIARRLADLRSEKKGLEELLCVLVGPWADIRAGCTRFADSGSPAFWDLDEDPKIVSEATACVPDAERPDILPFVCLTKDFSGVFLANLSPQPS